MQMQVRIATKDDAHILADLNRDVQQIHVEALPKLYKPVGDLKRVAADFQNRILADPEWRTWIVLVGDEPAGYVCAKVTQRPEHEYVYAQEYIYIDQISVRPAFRGTGCGRALMDAVFDLARAKGISRVALDTLAFNTAAVAFYERLGFHMFKHTMEIELTDERHSNRV